VRVSRLRLLVGVTIVGAGPGFVGAFANQVTGLAASPTRWSPFLSASVAGAVAWAIFFRRRMRIDTFVHELGHYLACLVFLRRVPRFHATDGGPGDVTHMGGLGGQFGDDFIGLAPYFFPPITLALAVIAPAVRHEWTAVSEVVVGASLGAHICGTAIEVRRNWSPRPFRSSVDGEWAFTDIRKRGYFYSTLFIAAMNFIFTGIIVSLVALGYPGVVIWGRDVADSCLSAHAFWLEHARHALVSLVAEAANAIGWRSL